AGTAILVTRRPDAIYPRDTTVPLLNAGDRPLTITGGAPVGRDASFFDVPDVQFPIALAPGAPEEMVVRILQPAEDRQYLTDISLAFAPACGLPEILVTLAHAGSRPALAADPLTFPSLLCDDPAQ